LTLPAAGSIINIKELYTIPDFITSIPAALTNCLLRPFPWEASELLEFAVVVENLFFILLIITTIINFKKPTMQSLNPILFCFTFCLLLALMVGWATPVQGAIVRYRTPFLPFLCIGLLLLQKPYNFKRLNFFK
jgi:hypothetical protein